MSMNISAGSRTLDITMANGSFESVWMDLAGAGIDTVNINFTKFDNRSIAKYVAMIDAETINITYKTGFKPSAMRDFMRGDTPKRLKHLNLINVDTSACSDWFCTFFWNATPPNPIDVTGALDFTSLGTWSNTLNAKGIRELRFVASTLSKNATIANDYNQTYSYDTWTSLANCLVSGASGTLTIGSTAQAKLQNILGNVENSLFVRDLQGLTNLYDFITTTKGWTLA